jgi:transposase-like protein
MTTITPELLDQLLANYEKPEDLTGDNGLFKQLKKALIERALGAELSEHLGYEKGDPDGRGTGNSRNGSSSKTLLTEDGEIKIAVPRDRAGSFEPQLVAKGQTRFDGFDDKILSLYARGMTVREIQGHTWASSTAPRSRPISSAGSPMPSSMRCGNGKTGRWRRSIRWFSSTRCASKSAMRAW